MPGSARQQLYDLEHQLLEAQQQFTVLKRNARALARMQKEVKCATCFVQEGNLQRRSMSVGMDTRSPADLPKKSSRMQTRRQHTVRIQALHVTSKEAESVSLENMSSNSDGLLLAVDKFLSAVDFQHGRPSNGNTSL
ncbi:hypothetical protein MARPO_0017s0005 [Marchantia polymorpha]|uniref:Uncharacterized protein n=1 Tax=Marchantia polymorpha TaxID=3197 RepID=A0A2R6XFJ7_MARPO|nr:hypothetical protein MARPO_0017s0005 [Marchantia polymorpha]|eukprot:PTQ44878.1 hypothetical protein MARPO_0017s0005 [Marchantia polymorpha]